MKRLSGCFFGAIGAPNSSATRGRRRVGVFKRRFGPTFFLATSFCTNSVDPRPQSTRELMWTQIKGMQRARDIGEAQIQLDLRAGASQLVVTASCLATPHDLAKSAFGDQIAREAIVAKVDGQLWDIHRSIPATARLIEILNWESPEARKVFWHSSAHILGQVLELEFGAKLTNGPPLDDGGFYYDVALPGSATLTTEQTQSLQQLIDRLLRDRQRFERLEVSKQDALRMFADNKYKLELINNKVPDGGVATIYKCGALIDLCKGPHIPHTGMVKALKVTKTSSSYWLGNQQNDSLQRVFGMSFPDKKLLEEWVKMQEEAAKRDHRVIGRQQELFMFHSLSPGSAFFLPRGAKLYNKLADFLRREYRKRGYVEVITPNIFNKDLWVTSGHWENYRDNMFVIDVQDGKEDHEHVQFGLKPMNCPGHCLIFDSALRSYRELPIRLADFGVLHRNELSGALTGLTRVRRFQQDDAHIFCTEDQIRGEITHALDFMKYVYSVFGFEDFIVELSTRPENNFLGDLEQWNQAESALRDALNSIFGSKWNVNPGDGAFYGPKIDVKVTDALRRQHQCATIQLDFQLPIRFGLRYRDEKDQERRPVIVHRAILGSIERFMAILIEHTAGKWPFWLSPRQAIVVPVRPEHISYAGEVQAALWNAGFDVDVDKSDNTLGKKIRDAQVEQYNFILVVGDREATKKVVNIRTRDNVQQGEKSLQQLLEHFDQLVTEKG